MADEVNDGDLGARVLAYWNDERAESMYDKNLLNLEIDSIKTWIETGTRILDAGCGEGEGTNAYADVPGVRVDAADFSPTRLRKAAARVGSRANVTLKQIDFLGSYALDGAYDAIVSQRFLINLGNWTRQSKVIIDLAGLLKRGGRLIILEGSQQGVNSLNEWRSVWNLPPIPTRWHNCFLDDALLRALLCDNGCDLREVSGFGSYFLLTRGIRPLLSDNLDPESDFNRIAATPQVRSLLAVGETFSRLKLWVFEKR